MQLAKLQIYTQQDNAQANSEFVQCNFSLHLRSFNHKRTWRCIWIQRTRFPMMMRSFKAGDAAFSDFCDDYLWACTLARCTSSTSGHKSQISHRKWIWQPGFPIRRQHFACKSTFTGSSSKLVKNWKLNYAPAYKSFLVTLPK